MPNETNESSVREQRVNEAIAAYLEAVDAGEAPDPKGFIAAHSDIAGELESFFANRDEFERMAEPLQPAGNESPKPLPDDVTLPPASEPTEAPTLAPTEAAGVAIGTMVRYFGDYELLEEIARGGMGVVYKARQVSLNRIVALKMILAGQLASEDDVKRFHAEAEAAANLDHPGIVPIYEVGEHEGQHYFSMGFVEGSSLSAKVADGPLPPREAAEYTKKVAEAVAFAHEHGVIHRDLKPANVLLDGNDQPKVTDFGLAKKVEGDSGLTATGQILGTPGYMPPEQASGKIDEVTETADVYSLGAILYSLLTGRPPFQADNPLDTLMQVLEREPVSPRTLNPKIPQDLETICLKCLEKDRHRRYASAQELGEEFQRFLSGEPIHARPISTTARAWRWCKRKPAMASLWAAVALLLLTFGVGGPIVAYKQADLRGQADDASAEAKRKRQEAEDARAETEEKRQEADDARADAEQRRQEAEEARAETEQKRQEADEARAEAERESERRRCLLYASHVNGAYQAWKAANVGRALELLRSSIPQPGQIDLRGFEWYYVWRLCNSEKVLLAGHAGDVRAIAYSPDGNTIATAGDDGVIRLSDAQGMEYASLRGHQGAIGCLAFSPDGSKLATGGIDKSVKLWDTTSREELFSFDDHAGSIGSLAFSAGGEFVTVGTASWGSRGSTPYGHYVGPERVGEVKLWNTLTGEASFTAKEHGAAVLAVTSSPDGTILATAGSDGFVVLWDVIGGEEPSLRQRHRFRAAKAPYGIVFAAAFSPDSKRLVTGIGNPYRESAEAKLWDVQTYEEIATLKGHREPVLAVAYAPDGATLATASSDRTVRLWNTDSNEELSCIRGHTDKVRCLAFSPDGMTLATASRDSTARIWDLTRQQDRDEIDLQGNSLEFSPDGRLLATASRQVMVWDMTTQQESFSPQGYRGVNIFAAISPDSKLLAAGGSSGALKVWDLTTQQEANTFGGHDDRIWSVDFSPDGNTIATAGHEGTVKLWDVHSGKELATLRQGKDWCRYLAFSPNGRTLAVIVGGFVELWDLESRSMQAKLKGGGFWTAFSPDGATLAVSVGVKSGKVVLWDVARRQVITVFEGHQELIYGGGFSADGKTLATAGWDGTVRLWQVETGQMLMTLDSPPGLKYAAAFSLSGRHLAIGSATISRHRAVALLEAASPDDVPGSVLWEAGRWGDAFVSYARAIDTCNELRQEHGETPGIANRLAAIHTELADKAFHAGLWPEATEHFAKALSLKPAKYPWPYEQYAMAALMSDDMESYHAACRSLLEACGDSEDGNILMRITRNCARAPGPEIDRAKRLAMAKRGLAVDPSEGWRALFVGLTYFRVGQYEEAATRIEQLQSKWPPAILALALAKFRLGQTDEAQQLLDGALSSYRDAAYQSLLSPDETIPGASSPFAAEVWAERSFLLHEAIRTFNPSEAGKGSADDPWQRMLRGRLMIRLDKTEEARELFQAVLQDDDGSDARICEICEQYLSRLDKQSSQ